MAVTILLNQVSKRYRNQWIFRSIDYDFEAGKKYAILGSNGSGKSTLLRIVAGMQHANKGTISYLQQEKCIASESIYNLISYAAPGMELVEEMTLIEFLKFHFTFKQTLENKTIATIIEEMGLHAVRNKFINEFSSGMKQRVKLAQAFFSNTPILLLDEPCSNLDLKGVSLYQSWLEKYTAGRTVVIASNDEREYENVTASFSVEDYK